MAMLETTRSIFIPSSPKSLQFNNPPPHEIPTFFASIKAMAFLLPNLSPPSLLQSKLSVAYKDKHSAILHAQSAKLPAISSTLTDTQIPSVQGSQLDSRRSTGPDQDKKQQRDDFYLNLGLAVRTLREDMPLIFTKDLNYDIYRDDITFSDPLNTFTGMENYKLIFWGLRFHGKILFREIGLEVFRVWQPSENVILIRWNLKGVPRVPWEAKGEFQGTSRYKLDRNGKIYEHKVDNLAFNFPQTPKPAISMLDLVTACPASPNPTFLWGPVEVQSSWIELYRAVRGSLDCERDLITQEAMPATCSYS